MPCARVYKESGTDGERPSASGRCQCMYSGSWLRPVTRRRSGAHRRPCKCSMSHYRVSRAALSHAPSENQRVTGAGLRSRLGDRVAVDGEAVACDKNGVDLRRDPLEVRKATLESILARGGPGIRFNEHIEGDGPTVFAHACKLGLEGIVSKRKDSTYRSGRSPDWLKMKNPTAPAVKREAEEDWGR